MSGLGGRFLGWLVSGCVLAFAGPVAAVDFPVSGLLFERRGSLEIPLPTRPGQPGQGIAFSGTVSQTGAPVPGGGPATLALPASLIVRSPVPAGLAIAVPSIVQVTTAFSHLVPASPATLMAGRSGPASFAYCPGATVNPSCTTVATGPGLGTRNGIVRYTAGPNRFGGTMKALVGGSGRLTRRGISLPPTVMDGTMTIPALNFSGDNVPLFAAGSARATIPAGRPYASMLTFELPQRTGTHPYGYMVSQLMLLSRGPQIALRTVSSSEATGFPLTTGAIYVYRTVASQSTSGFVSKLSLTGSDGRSAGGSGTIQLVSGYLSRTFPTDGSNPPEGSRINSLVLELTVPEPSATALAIVALVTLGWSRKRLGAA